MSTALHYKGVNKATELNWTELQYVNYQSVLSAI